MSTLTSSSTITEIEAAYIDNASFEEDSSASKCRAFITACRVLLLKRPSESRHGGSGMTWSMESIRSEMQRAAAWLAAQPDTATDSAAQSYADFSEFRE